MVPRIRSHFTIDRHTNQNTCVCIHRSAVPSTMIVYKTASDLLYSLDHFNVPCEIGVLKYRWLWIMDRMLSVPVRLLQPGSFQCLSLSLSHVTVNNCCPFSHQISPSTILGKTWTETSPLNVSGLSWHWRNNWRMRIIQQHGPLRNLPLPDRLLRDLTRRQQEATHLVRELLLRLLRP